MFAWPLIVGALALLASSQVAVLWGATVVATAVVVPIVYAVSAVMLGAVGPGGIAVGVLVALLAWLLAPQLEAIGGSRWTASGAVLAAGVLVIAFGMATIRSTPDHPTPSLVAYALDADSTGAWLAARGPNAGQLDAANGAGQTPPAWLSRTFGSGKQSAYAGTTRLDVQGPVATVVTDSTTAGERRLVLRIRAPSGTETISMRAASGTRVLRSSIDGRAIDTSRYRGGAASWRLEYAAPPDSGITLALTGPAGAAVTLEVLARSPGVPTIAGVRLPTRTADVVTAQTGDVTVVHRTLLIP
jgi:hypothetical protein